MASEFDDSGLKKKIAKLLDIKSDVMKKVLPIFVKNTPIDKGNARRSTKLKNNTIEADYEYAFVLDGGRKKVGNKVQGSTQAPKGMTEPTKKEMEKIVIDQIKKVGN